MKEEYELAMQIATRKKRQLWIIPILLKDAKIPGFLKSRKWIDFRDQSKYNSNVVGLVWGITGKSPTSTLATIPTLLENKPSTTLSIKTRIQNRLKGYKKKYLEHIYYRHKYFDFKGFSTHGAFNLDLNEIFIELTLIPYVKNHSRPFDRKYHRSEHGTKIWDYIKHSQEKLPGERVVILGIPGSGKTTLLKQVALKLSMTKQNAQQQKIPILLSVRDYAEEIARIPTIKISSLIESSLHKADIHVPESWFDDLLHRGKCVVMLDGLDEVADEKMRKSVVNWVQTVMMISPKNHFIVTSRPHGYDANPLEVEGVTLLEISELAKEEVKEFVQKWYLANEIRRSQNDDLGVRYIANEGAEDLLARLRDSEPLSTLALNPMLLTMIATVHRFKTKLPERRVELYNEIFDVFLGGERRKVVGKSYELTQQQKREILKPLAYKMMLKEFREIPINEALEIIKPTLSKVYGQLDASTFLKQVEQESGLLLEIEKNIIAFAHLTFQEYLAAEYIKDRSFLDAPSEEFNLINFVNESWWNETILLCAAITNATPIIRACLSYSPIPRIAYSLAVGCLKEGLKMEEEIRQDLQKLIQTDVYGADQWKRSLSAGALLYSHLRWMEEDSLLGLAIDAELISNSIYQLFVDEGRERGLYFQPDHWKDYKHTDDIAFGPVSGVRSTDAIEFCEWLTRNDAWGAHYRLLTPEEAKTYPLSSDTMSYWTRDNSGNLSLEKETWKISTIYKEWLISTIEKDLIVQEKYFNALRREMERKTTDELLASAPVVASSHSTYAYSSFHDLAERKHIEEEQERLEEWIILNHSRKYSTALNLDINQIFNDTNFSRKLNPASLKDAPWIPQIIYPPKLGFDIDTMLFYFVQDFNDYKTLQALKPGENAYSEILIKLHKLIKDRCWDSESDDTEIRAEKYDFLRYYIRKVILDIILASTRRENRKENKVTTLTRSGINTLLAFAILEQRIQNKIKPFEGIRIVKEKGS